MENSLWPEPLLYFLDLTKRRSNNKKWAKKRFSLLIKTHNHIIKNLKIIKIAGTNGKGSVGAMLECCLREEQKNVGLFTSPHLYSVTERFRINQQEVTLKDLEFHAKALRPEIESFIQTNGDDFIPSFFEILILLALRLFHQYKVEIAIFEAGIGGYNDATCLLPAVISTITAIGLDHLHQLGPSIETIAADKAGIAPDNTVLILGPTIGQNLCDIIAADCRLRNVTIRKANAHKLEIVQTDCRGTTLNVSLDGFHGEIRLNLLGLYQVDNFLTTAKVFEYLLQHKLIGSMNSLARVEKTIWAGRMEYIKNNPAWLLDVAHNPHALQAFSGSIALYFDYSSRVLVFGTSIEKDIKASLNIARELAPMSYLVSGFYKAVSLEELRLLYPGAMEGFISPEVCVDRMVELYKDTSKTIIVVGSVFLVGSIRQYLLNMVYKR